MNALQVTGLTKAHGAKPVLTGVDLAVAAGSITALLGSSGSGKTTLLRVVAGFERAAGGTVTLSGRVVAGPGVHLPPERRQIGYVPQEGALFPHLTVAENVAFGLPRAERHGPRVAELLDLTGLAGLDARYPSQLSGGQQQRTALARALAPRPALVLLDEPFTALDLDLRRAVCRDVVAALRRANATALLVTHDPPEAFASADQVAVLCRGRVAQHDTPQRVYRTPADAETARLTGPALFLPATVAGDAAECALGRVPLAAPCPAGPASLLVRPEQLAVAPDGPGVAATVLGCTFLGDRTAVTVALGPDPLTASLFGITPVAAGDRVMVRVTGACTAFAAS